MSHDDIEQINTSDSANGINVPFFYNVDTTNDFIFDDFDKLQPTESATNLIFLFGEVPEYVFCSPLVGIDNKFDCRCAPIISQSNDFILSCDDSSFTVSFSHGSNLSSDFIRTYKVAISHGSSLYGEIDYRQGALLSSTASSGESVSAYVQSNKRLSAQIYHGDSVHLDITYRARANLSVEYFHGSSLSISTQYNYAFNTTIDTGDTLSAVIGYRPRHNITSNNYVGSELKGKFQTSKLIVANIYHGNSTIFDFTPMYAVYLNDINIGVGTSLDIDMTTIPSNNLNSEIYTGDELEANIATSSSFTIQSLHGENVTYSLSTKSSLACIAEHGDVMNVALQYNPPVLLTANIYSGSQVNSKLSVSSILSSIVQYGENVSLNIKYAISTGSEFYARTGSTMFGNFVTSSYIKTNVFVGSIMSTELEIRQPKTMSVTFESGANLSLENLNSTVAFSPRFAHGESMSISSIDNLKNIYFSSGESVVGELASQLTLNDNKFYHGEVVQTQLKTGQSFPLGTFDVQSGSTLEYILTTQISTYFSPRFSFEAEFVQTAWDTTFVDLNKLDCCPPSIDDVLYVNLQHDKEVEARYDIPYSTDVRGELTATPIFYPEFLAGTTFYVKEYDMLLSGDFHYGENVNVLDLYNDLVVDLNSGNPEYDDSEVIVETSKDYTEFKNSFATISDGASVSFELCVSYDMHGDGYAGHYMRGDFYVEQAWRATFYGLSEMRATLSTNIQFKNINYYDGSQMSGTLYEEPIRFAHGENVSCSLTVEYDVAFVDDGCLDNRHIPTIDGVPIIDPTNEMAIEGQYFSRFIQGRCF